MTDNTHGGRRDGVAAANERTALEHYAAATHARLSRAAAGRNSTDHDACATALERAIQTLTPIQRVYIRLRYGLGGDGSYTFGEIDGVWKYKKHGWLDELKILRKLRSDSDLRKYIKTRTDDD